MNNTVIFDLDGTIADSESVFFRIVNELAPDFGYAPLDPNESKTLKELPLRNFLLKRLGWRIVFLPGILHAGRARYQAIANEVPVFPGMKEVLETLRRQGYRIGIVSSSEERTIKAIFEAHGLVADFIAHSSLFGKAHALKKVLHEHSLTAGETLYVGDEIRDVEACRKADLPIIAVAWGLNSEASLRGAGAETVATPNELLASILSKRLADPVTNSSHQTVSV